MSDEETSGAIALDIGGENSYLKVIVEDIEALAAYLGATPENKLSIIVYYKDSATDELRVWDGK